MKGKSGGLFKCWVWGGLVFVGWVVMTVGWVVMTVGWVVWGGGKTWVRLECWVLIAVGWVVITVGWVNEGEWVVSKEELIIWGVCDWIEIVFIIVWGIVEGFGKGK